jgi:hypothetical protein
MLAAPVDQKQQRLISGLLKRVLKLSTGLPGVTSVTTTPLVSAGRLSCRVTG